MPEDKIRVSAAGAGRFDIKGLTQDEVDLMNGFILGVHWVHIKDGRLESVQSYKNIPPPAEDPLIPPRWIGKERWEDLAPFLATPVPPLPDEPRPKHEYPTITINGLCGYSDSPYNVEAAKLESYGFECLRSRRGRDGRFWELWYLPGTWSAKGALLEYIKDIEGEPNKIKALINFLCRYVAFGSLNVCYQKACAVLD